MVIDLIAYRLALQPIPERIEKSVQGGVRPGEFPDWPEAPRLFQDWDAYADRVTRARDGRVLVACATEMPGVAPAMIDWWFDWHMTSTERYRLWHPRAHAWSRVKESREEIAANRPQYVGKVSLVNEYIGKSLRRFEIAFRHPAEFGFSPEALSGSTAVCARTADRVLNTEGGCLVHRVTPTETGSRMRSAFWLGGITPRWPVAGRLLAPALNTAIIRKIVVPDGMALDLLWHCAEEMNHLVRFLPALYSRVRGKQ